MLHGPVISLLATLSKKMIDKKYHFGNFIELSEWYFSKISYANHREKTLREFWEKHPETRAALLSWFATVEDSIWQTPANVSRTFSKARTIPNNRVIFDIMENNYRLVVSVNYKWSVVYIRFIGTHGDYDRIDAETV